MTNRLLMKFTKKIFHSIDQCPEYNTDVAWQGCQTKFRQGGGKMKRNVSIRVWSAHDFFLPPPLEHTIGFTDEVCTRFLQLKLNRSVFFDLSIPREGTRCKSSGGVNAPIVPPIGRHYHLKRNSSIIFIAFWIFKYPVSGFIRYPAHSDIRQDNPDPVFTDRIYPVSGSGTKIESGKTLI